VSRPFVIALLLLVATPAAPALSLLPAAIADFAWSPTTIRAQDSVTFVDASDPHGTIILATEWRFNDTGLLPILDASVTRSFPKWGHYPVRHAVIDSTGHETWVEHDVVVESTPPVAQMYVSPEGPVRRGTVVSFASASFDIDGDAIVSTTWDFGDGETAAGPNASHAWSALGVYPVRIDIVNDIGEEAAASYAVEVVNAAPYVFATQVIPSAPVAGEPVLFRAAITDPDGPSEVLVVTWSFSDDVAMTGQNVERAFPQAGTYRVTVVVRDAEGGVSMPISFDVVVG
jgi:PKD repeat protein